MYAKVMIKYKDKNTHLSMVENADVPSSSGVAQSCGFTVAP